MSSSSSSQKNKENIMFTIGIIAFFSFILIKSFSLSKTAGSVPMLTSAIGIGLSVMSLITDLKKSKKVEKIEVKEEDPFINEEQGISFFKSLFFIVSYLVAMIILGFYLSTFLILFVLVKQLNYNNIKVNLVFSFLTSSILFFIFKFIFYVRLPMGILFDLF